MGSPRSAHKAKTSNMHRRYLRKTDPCCTWASHVCQGRQRSSSLNLLANPVIITFSNCRCRFALGALGSQAQSNVWGPVPTQPLTDSNMNRFQPYIPGEEAHPILSELSLFDSPIYWNPVQDVVGELLHPVRFSMPRPMGMVDAARIMRASINRVMS